MESLLSLTVMCLAFINIGLTTPQQQCQFPQSWEGTWYHSGFPHPLNISRNHISSKGTCLQQSGSMFILADKRHNCQKCMVIHEKHPNVLQYKESYCHASVGFSGSLESLCSSIESDSPLFFIFRTRRGDKKLESEACPFKNIEYAFSYSTRGGAKVCQQPPSRLDTCTDEAKMVFQFQACPDVPGSERTDEVLECVATWKEGSSRYLVGRIMSPSQLPSSSKYQCFRYERHYDEKKGGIVVKMAQSYSGACEGLWSAEEGDRTYTFWTVPTEFRECGLPQWIVNGHQWTSMSSSGGRSSSGGSGSPHQTNLQMTSARRFKMVHNGQLSQMTCKRILEGMDHKDHKVKLVAYEKKGCFSGFICLELTFLHENVVRMRMGNRSRHEEEACRHHFFSGKEAPEYLLADGKSIDCPFYGKFVEEEPEDQRRGNTRMAYNTAGEKRQRCQSQLQSGCPLSTDMLIHLCGLSKQRMRDVTCIGTWREDPEMGPIYTEETEEKEAVTRVGDEAKADNQSLLDLQAAKYPRILALRDQKGSGECLEYRKIENSLQVSLLPQCQLLRREPQKLRNGSSQDHDSLYLQNFTLKGSCQEALRDKHAVALGVKATLPYSFLLSSQISFIILITTVTVMWNF